MVTELIFNLRKNEGIYGTSGFRASINNIDALCLFDSGAFIPVYTLGVDAFLNMFPDAVKTKDVFLISGFGGAGVEISSAYNIPEVILSDGNNTITLKNFCCAVLCGNISYPFIFGYSIFEKMNVHLESFDEKTETVLSHNRLRITSLKSEYAVSRKYKQLSEDERCKFNLTDNDNVLESVYIFTQT